MKKLHILLAAALLAAGFSSCDMEKYPYNAVEESLYMTSTQCANRSIFQLPRIDYRWIYFIARNAVR